MSINIKTGNMASDLEWKAYTPTGTWTTNVTYTGYYRVVGDTLEQMVTVTMSGVPGPAVPLQINLALGSSINASKFIEATGSRSPVGQGILIGGGSWISAVMTANTAAPTYTKPYAPLVSGSLVAMDAPAEVTPTTPTAWNTGDQFNLDFSVPIS
jgi:hypothetical protein